MDYYTRDITIQYIFSVPQTIHSSNSCCVNTIANPDTEDPYLAEGLNFVAAFVGTFVGGCFKCVPCSIR